MRFLKIHQPYPSLSQTHSHTPPTMAALNLSLLSKTLNPNPLRPDQSTSTTTTAIGHLQISAPVRSPSLRFSNSTPKLHRSLQVRAAVDGEYSAKRGSSNNEPRETIMLPGCDYNHWLIVMEFPKDPVPSREQMIETYLNTLATVVGSMEEAKKNMYAFSTTTYTGFQCTVSEETSEKFKGLPGVLWVLPDSYIDVKNKDYGGDKYVNGEIIPCQYPTYQPKQNRRSPSKYESKKYVRQRDGPPPEKRRPKPATTSEAPPS